MKNVILSQEKQVLSDLQLGYRVTKLDALKWYGCMNLGDRIFTLRKKGYPIRTKMVEKNGKRFAEYFL